MALPPSFTPEFFKRLELLKLRSKRKFLGTRQGGHISPKRGHGIEFADYRQYELGDSPRWIDWGVYARTDKLFIRRFQEEQNIAVLFVLDKSASMTTPVEDGKWIRAKELILALAYLALSDQDSVRIVTLDGVASPIFVGAKAFHSAVRFLDELVDPSANSDFGAGMRAAAALSKFPGIAVVVSDLLVPREQIIEGMSTLLSKNLDASVLQVVGVHDEDPLAGRGDIIAEDSETGAEVELVGDVELLQKYRKKYSQHVAQLKDYFAAQQIRYCYVGADTSLEKEVPEALKASGIVG